MHITTTNTYGFKVTDLVAGRYRVERVSSYMLVM